MCAEQGSKGSKMVQVKSVTLNCSTPTVLGREYGESVNLSQTGANDS